MRDLRFDQRFQMNHPGVRRRPLATLFDNERQRALVRDRDGNERALSGRAAANAAGEVIPNGLFLRLKGLTGRGGILLVGLPAMNWDRLEVGQNTAIMAARALDDYWTARIAQEAAILGQRKAIARDLHDSIAQSLAGAKFWLQTVRNKLDPGSPAARELDSIKASLSVEHDKLREMIERLKFDEAIDPTSDLCTDLASLAELLAMHWRMGEITVEGPEGGIAVPTSLSYEVQQMLREAVSNAVRHGAAAHLTVTLAAHEGDLALTIADDGTGFAEGAMMPPLSLHERTAALGGTLRVESASGNTRLYFHIPLEGAA